MKNVAYWTPTDDPLKGKTLVYILAHASREAATANWKAFGDDPEWQSVREKSEANGKIVEKVDSTFLAFTDFSPRLPSIITSTLEFPPSGGKPALYIPGHEYALTRICTV